MADTDGIDGHHGGQLLSNDCTSIYSDPLSLPLTKRFDVIAKYLFVKNYEQYGGFQWCEELYCEHIKVLNNFVETDGSGKVGKSAFLSSFKQTIASIKTNGYEDGAESIRLGKDGVPLDGAHRISASLFFGNKIKICRSGEKEYIYDYKFFQRRGLKPKYCDPVAIEYCKLNQCSFLAIVYPSAAGKDCEVEETLTRWGDIFYRKNVCINSSGSHLLVQQIYSGEDWIGNRENGFKGAKSKVQPCFSGNGPVRVYVINSSLEKVVKAKEEIRQLFNIGKHSIHITDTQEESVRLAQLLLNENSVHYLNHATNKNYVNFFRFFEKYKSMLESRVNDADGYCIDGSAVLSVFGIRDSQDLDYLHFEFCDKLDGDRDIQSHNEEATYYDVDTKDIVSDPSYHFYFDGFKFASLKVIYDMKRKRSEVKDEIDIRKIELAIGQDKILPKSLIASTLLSLLSLEIIKTRLEIIKIKFRYFFAVLWKNLKKIYKWLFL